jgi:hypothetical protein
MAHARRVTHRWLARLTGGPLLGSVLLACSTTLPPPSLGPTPLPSPSPVSAATLTFTTSCETPPSEPGLHLGCVEAVNAALSVLGSDRPPLKAVIFQYDCPGNLDCAVQLSGMVEVTYTTQPPQTLRVGVWRNTDGGLTAKVMP